jgi:hypothetical protein
LIAHPAEQTILADILELRMLYLNTILLIPSSLANPWVGQ